MTNHEYAQVNTSISVRESKLLTKDDFDQLLRAQDMETLAHALQGTPYDRLDEGALEDPNQIEEVLIRHLAKEYAFAFAESPSQFLVQLFALRYTYHNLKVLLKARASQQDLSKLLLPIGAYSREVLENLVSSLTSEICPRLMQEEVASTWSDYQDYQDIRVLDMGMDMAYFKHLKSLVEDFEQDELRQFVDLTVDFYNVITVKRGLNQGKPRSFMRQLLSEDGLYKARDYLRLFENQELLSWFNQIYPESYDQDLVDFEDQLANLDISARDLEYLMDILRFKILDHGRFETQGPLPLARYLWGKEMEIKNLRLILTGRSNGLAPELLEERMRPIYGQ